MSLGTPVADEDAYPDGPPPLGEPPTKRRWPWKRILLGVVLLFLLLVAWLAWTAPLGRALEPLDQPALVLLDDEGTPFARRGDLKEQPVDIASLPPHVVDAVLSTEDRRFYDHIGVDIRGLTRAFLANMAAGEVVQGGSTITQQLAKTSFLTHERSYRRKAQEVIIALWLESWLSKDEILSRYLSSVYFGEGAYGLRAAARTYFDREPEKLTLAQGAMLAGIIKAPSALAPSRHLKRAQERSEVVLQTMVEAGKLTQREAERTRPAKFVRGRPQLPNGTYFADWVMPQAREAMEGRHFGEVRVRTTLDPDLQKLAERVVREFRGQAAAADAAHGLKFEQPGRASLGCADRTLPGQPQFDRRCGPCARRLPDQGGPGQRRGGRDLPHLALRALHGAKQDTHRRKHPDVAHRRRLQHGLGKVVILSRFACCPSR